MEPNATNEIVLTGLNAILPAEKNEGKNRWTVSGWEIKMVEGEQKFILRMADKRKTGAMGANTLLSELSDFELKHPAILSRRTDGGFDYKTPVVIDFYYTSKKVPFKTPYTVVQCYLKGTEPALPPASKPGVGMGHPTKDQEIAAFV